MAETFQEWTRLKNDAVRQTCDVSQSTAPLKFVTFAPDYLEQASCVRGDGRSNNCRVYGETAEAEFPRMGKLSNLRQNQRADTGTFPAMGMPTAPHQGNGPLLPSAELGRLSDIHGQQQVYAKTCDAVVDGQPVRHQLDSGVLLSSPMDGYADRLPPRDQTGVSTRVGRRNEWARKCTS